ncbi:MAG: mechanosensitive ion channel domain-containing protein [Pseudomonadota bacterium]
MAEESEAVSPLDYIRENSDEIARQVGEYGYVVGDSLYLIVAGMLAVYLLHTLASKFLYPYMPNARLPRVIFGTLYLLVLVVTVLMALNKIGLDTGPFGPTIIILVIVGAVVVYFLIPFMPRLPFMPGHLIETGGVMGVVDSISSFHTTLRKFDGNIVFLPNALVMASRIQNFSYTPNRRIELKLRLAAGCDPEMMKARLLERVASESRVLDDPAPVIYATGADASGVDLVLYCWASNADFMATQSSLWLQLVALARADEQLSLAVPQQEVYVHSAV